MDELEAGWDENSLEVIDVDITRQIESASGIQPHPELNNSENHFIIVFANVLA
ncbi:MAG: hypothetical protein HXS52_05690 [Theionarchaea archaeon]|nr:hypothetical protein [Theionarchaea archaeon]